MSDHSHPPKTAPIDRDREWRAVGPTAILALLAALPVQTPPIRSQPGEAASPPRVQSFTVSQVSQVASIPPTLEVHLALLDANGDQLAEIQTPPEVDGSLGAEPVDVKPLVPFDPSAGVAYVALVDTSASLTTEAYARLQQALTHWIRSFSPADQLAIVGFGESSRVLLDFTDDLDAAERAIADLAPTERLTVLHRGLITALDLAGRSDAELPDRRAIVVLSDGQDDGSGITVEDVIRRVETSSRFPIYAIGLSSLRGSERRRSLDVLLRLATASGGAYFEAGRTELDEAYERIDRSIRDVWVARVECSRCPTDGAERHLDLRLRSAGRVVSRGADIRLLPGLGTSPLPSTPASGGSAPVRSPGRSALLYGGIALALVLLGALALPLARSRRRRAPPTASGIAHGAAPEPVAPAAAASKAAPAAIAAASSAEPAVAPRAPAARDRRDRETELDGAGTVTVVAPAEPRALRIDVVRGVTQGAQRRLLLSGDLTIGSRSTCDLVLGQETNLAPEQLALVQSGYRILLEDRSGGSTLINGRRPSDPQPIRSGDLVGNRDVILRIVFES